MPEPPLLTVPQVAAEFQVTAQTIRNWIDQGVLPAVRVGRAFRIRRADVDALLDRAQAESESLATQRDPWSPEPFRLPRADSCSGERSVWDGDCQAGGLPNSGDLMRPGCADFVRAHSAGHPWPPGDTLSQAPRSTTST
jgi:excisionase family DNA binding protein